MLPRTRCFAVAVCIVFSQPALYGWHQPRVNGGTSILLNPQAVPSFTAAPGQGACSYSLSPTTATVPAFGASASRVSVTTGTGCPWSVVSNAGWITVVSGASGTGSTTVSYDVGANGTGSQRAGTIAIAGLLFTVTQSATTCSYSLGSTSASVPSTGGTSAFSVVTGSSCAWTAVSSATWITVTGGATGTGIGTVSYSVAANTTGSQRIGIITVAGRTHTVTQAANSCSYSLGSTGASIPSTGATSAFSVVTGTSCAWTAVSSVTWITVTGGATGAGIGTVSYSVAANTTGTQRVGIITVADRTHTVTQAASSCSYTLGTTTASVPSTGAASSAVSVVTGTGCSWSAASNVTWLTVTGAATGTGMGAVTYSVAANPTATPRVGTITVAAATLTVTQAAATPPAAPQNLRIIR